jgi:hypothetical protein
MMKLNLFVCAVVLVGCHARETRMTPKPLQAQPLGTFSLTSQDLKYNRVFLWKSGVNAEQVSIVLKNSENIDILEGTYIGLKNKVETLQIELQNAIDLLQSNESEVWNEMSLALADASEAIEKQTKRLEQKKKDQQAATEKQTVALNLVAGLEGEIAKTKLELETELALPESEQDKDKIKALTMTLESKNAEKQVSVSDVETLKQKLTQIQSAIDNLEVSLNESKNALVEVEKNREARFPHLAKKDEEIRASTEKLEKHQDESGPKLEKYLSKVVDNVDEFSEITSVKLGNSGGQLSVEIQGWNLGNGIVRDFSNQTGEITNVKYFELGGRFEFEVKTDEQSIYSFKLVRTRYQDPGGRIIYQGDVVCKRHGEVRSGVAKFIDRNLN